MADEATITDAAGEPPPPPECLEALAIAARLWLRAHGVPASYALGDSHFTMLAERVLWQQVRAMR